MNDSLAVSPVSPEDTGYQEMRWPLRHLTIAGVHWPAEQREPQRPPVVMLHGWLDNCLSFSRLAPALAEATDVYALDMAGHGHSGHRPAGQGYLLADYVADLAEVLETGFEGPVDLVGHSLGGIVCMMYAAAFPEKVRKLVVIDSLGPITKASNEAVSQLRRGIIKRLAGSGSSAGYRTREEAATARAGGLSPLSPEAAAQLVGRNLRETAQGYQWRTDPRLRHPSLMMYNDDQAMAFLEGVQAPTLLVRAEGGLLGTRERWQRRLDAVHRLTEITVAGSHHCHLDGDTRPVADAVGEFLSDKG
ncbi:MAG: alpha/beta hydrolase [Marinobacter sp.]|uniref:alpha/beta fold hydrolase n=1 Tax=Marinobacter sp. TaxID=50741 RepID=UPI00299EA8C6|nr:alpha/beta hydrolase [Marinobacter sp.]MDX1633142.1 alpha/beta hydrolase [Marinobacter sp.]